MTRTLAVLAFAASLAACAGGNAAQRDDRYVRDYRRLHPAVVLLTMQIPAVDAARRGLWDDAFGSGVVVASGAWGSQIITDAHVIDGARNLVATIGDGPHATARVVARSNDDADLALLEARIPNRPVAELGTSAGIEPGTPVGVLGYPIPDAFQDEKLGRTVSLYAGRVASVRTSALELDVPIIPGESGGPVFDAASGLVIGIAESRFEDERAIGFATPIDEAKRFVAAHGHR